MERILKISKFRNIGLDKPEKLILNYSMKKGEIGDLLILIGPNNSGKSNVLEALQSIAKKELSERDITTLSYDSKDRVPHIELELKNKQDYINYTLTYKGKIDCEFNVKDKINSYLTKEKLQKDLTVAADYLSSIDKGGVLNNILDQLNKNEFPITREYADKIIGKINKIAEGLSKVSYYHPNEHQFNTAMPSDGYWKFSRNLLKNAEEYCKEKYEIPLIPNVITYKENPLVCSNLQTSFTAVKNSNFYQSLFKAIDIDIDIIQKTYEQYKEFHNSATLTKTEKEINGKIVVINEQFNKLYFAESDEYKFSIKLGENEITFGMSRGKDEDPIMLDYQSTGFRWFFNFFFNFILSTKLMPGDIIIMDEPATNLHPKGQNELRRFIKSFAKKNDLTFIIATHSPFLIDIDNYDELRVVSMVNNRSKIDNIFSAVNYEDPDCLLPIKEALTIEQNVLYSPKTEIIFVEGITDYNYLTMFKRIFSVKDIAFIPCNGIGNTDESRSKILKKLLSLEYPKKNILVDGDIAGKKMIEACKNTAFENIICISDLEIEKKKFKEIEDLFSKEDKEKYEIMNKTVRSSSILKSNSSIGSFTEETINNFKALFDRLKD